MNAFEQISRCALGQQGSGPDLDGHLDPMLGWVAIYIMPARRNPECRFPIVSLLRQP